MYAQERIICKTKHRISIKHIKPAKVFVILALSDYSNAWNATKISLQVPDQAMHWFVNFRKLRVSYSEV